MANRSDLLYAELKSHLEFLEKHAAKVSRMSECDQRAMASAIYSISLLLAKAGFLQSTLRNLAAGKRFWGILARTHMVLTLVYLHSVEGVLKEWTERGICQIEGCFKDSVWMTGDAP